MWAILALGAAVLSSFNPILYKRILKDADSLLVVWGVTLLSLPLLGLFTFVLTPQIPKQDWLFAFGVIGSAALNAVAQIAFARALKMADASLITPLLIFSPVFTLLFSALILGEIPSLKGLSGVGLVLFGAYWLNRKSDAGWLAPFRSLAQTPGVGLVLLAGLLWSITPLFEKTAILHTNPESPRFAAFVATALLTLLLTPAVMARGKSAINKLTLHGKDMLLAGLIAGISPVLGYTAMSLGFVGYVTTLFKLSTFMTVLWGFLFLKEHGLAQRLPGSLIMVIGAILIAT